MSQSSTSVAAAGSSIILVIVAVIGLVASVAAILAYAKANFAKAQIEALRGDRDDLQARVKILEEENPRTEASLRVEQSKVSALEKVVTGKEELKLIQIRLESHEKSMQTHAVGLDSKLTMILAAVKENR